MITLLPHQEPAFAYAKSRSRIALFMEMRLGKTIVTMQWVQHHQLRRVLLLAPWNTLVGTHNWQGELTRAGQKTTMLCLMEKVDRASAARWTWSTQTHTAQVRSQTLVRQPATGWFLLHFEGLRVTPELLALPWDAVIVDESTRIRNPQARISKLLISQVDAPYRAILSGLPNPESPLDFFSQFHFLLGHFDGFTNFWAYRASRFNQGDFGWQWYPRTGTLESIKRFVHVHSFLLSRTNAKVGSKKVYETRTVPMDTKQQRAVREVAKKWAYGETEAKHAPVIATWMQQIAGGFAPTDKVNMLSDGKVRLLHELLTEEFLRESVVVWFRFNHEIDAVYNFLQNRKRKSEQVVVERLHGGLEIPKTERAQIQNRFQDGTTRVLLMQVKLGQFGWNLSRANVMMYYSNTYEFEDRSQSEDRIIHPTKTVPCTIVDLVTIGSADEDVVDALRDKKMDSKRLRSAMAAHIAARLTRITRINPGDVV